MFDTITRSFSLTLSSWQLLRSDKQLLVFPILSGIACLLILAGFAAPFILDPQLLAWADANQQGHAPPWVLPVAFAFYFCTYFVIIFCNAALIGCAILRFNGEPASVADGFRVSFSRMPQILGWALVSATVGLLLMIIENSHKNVGRFVSSLLGAAWTVMTYFVVPVLVVEKVGPIEAVKRSLQILRQTWGEALVGQAGIGLVMFLAMLPGALVGALGIWALQTVPAVGIALLVIAGVYLLIWAAVGPALKGIFLAALYQYATTKTVPNGFDGDVLAHCFAQKKAT